MNRTEEFKVRRLFASAMFFAEVAKGDDMAGAISRWMAEEQWIQALEAKGRYDQKVREIVLKNAKPMEGGVIHFYGLDKPGPLSPGCADIVRIQNGRGDR